MEEVQAEEPVSEVAFVEETAPEVEEITSTIEFTEEPVSEVAFVEETAPEVEEITSTIEFTEEPVAEVEEVQSEEVPATIMIGSDEVSLSLYQLFKQECDQYVVQMENMIDMAMYASKPVMPHDFMRFAHTLSSISATVKMSLLSKVAHAIEEITKSSFEKNVIFTKDDLKVLGNAISAIKTLKDDLTLSKDALFNEIMNELSLLNDRVSAVIEEDFSDEYAQADEDEEFKVFDMSGVVEEISSRIRNDVLSEISGKQDAMQNEISKAVATSLEAVSDKLSAAFSSQEKRFAEALEKQEKYYEAKLNDMMNRLSESQIRAQKTLSHNLGIVHKEVSALSGELKKKFDSKALGFSGEVEGDVIQGVVISALENENIASTPDLSNGLSVESNFEFESVDGLDGTFITEEMEFSSSEDKGAVVSDSSLGMFADNEYVREIFEEKISLLEDEVDFELFPIAKMEGDEQLVRINEILENLQDKFVVSETNELKRLLHTLKGGARMAGANKVGGIAHRLESLLDYTEGHNIAAFNIKELLLAEVDKIVFLFDNISTQLSESKLHWLDHAGASVSLSSNVSTASETSEMAADADKKDTTVQNKHIIDKQIIRVSSDVIDGLVNEAGEIRMTRSNIEGAMDRYKEVLVDLKASSIKLQQILREIDIQAESQMQSRKEELIDSGKDFDPLEFDRFTRLQELTRFMSEAVGDISDSVNGVEGLNKRQDYIIAQQSILTTNLLTDLMKVRLVSVESISDRLYKITRQTAKELNKKVMLEFSGEKTEIDRIVLDRMINPIEHLLRNCIAHGIEMPDTRIMSKKNPVGRVLIDTKIEGNFIILNIKDDGAGINTNKIKEVAISKGLYQKDKEYTDAEIINFIFAPGFSTADSVSQVSGRGVGMDVVRSEISALGGSVSVDTNIGSGTTFSITLPASLTTSQSMLLDVTHNNTNQLCALPTALIDEVLSVKLGDMKKAFDNGEIVSNNEKYKLMYLGHLLGTNKTVNPEFKNYNTVIATSYLGEKLAIFVDKVHGASEILVKNVGSHIAKISGIVGATILGDGRQGLIVNPLLLKKHWDQYLAETYIEGALSSTDTVNAVVVDDKPKKARSQIVVMVVDDSLTVRKASTRLLERYGYRVITGKDGEDGLEQLQKEIPDIILSDIEMPRMDGFEFSKNVKNNEKYAHIPIIMITSRTADKHREHAMSLGVNMFLGKPYKEDELIDGIRELTKVNA